jgi:hypothetical protein
MASRTRQTSPGSLSGEKDIITPEEQRRCLLEEYVPMKTVFKSTYNRPSEGTLKVPIKLDVHSFDDEEIEK